MTLMTLNSPNVPPKNTSETPVCPTIPNHRCPIFVLRFTARQNHGSMKNKRIPIHSLTQHCDDKIPAYFKVSSFDAMACTVAEFQENHRHEHYEIVWLKRGNGVHMIDGQSYAYNGAVLFLLSPGQVHRLDQQEKAEGYVLKFLPDIFSDPKDADKYLLHSGLFDNIEAEPVLKPTASLCFFNIFINTADAKTEKPILFS